MSLAPSSFNLECVRDSGEDTAHMMSGWSAEWGPKPSYVLEILVLCSTSGWFFSRAVWLILNTFRSLSFRALLGKAGNPVPRRAREGPKNNEILVSYSKSENALLERTCGRLAGIGTLTLSS